MLNDFNKVPDHKTEGFMLIIDPAAKDYLIIKSKDLWTRYRKALDGSVGAFKSRYPNSSLSSLADNFKFRWVKGTDDTIKNRIISEMIQEDYAIADISNSRDMNGPFNVYLVVHNFSSNYALFTRKVGSPPITYKTALNLFNKSTKDNVKHFLYRYSNMLDEINFSVSVYPEVFEDRESAKRKISNVTKRRGTTNRLM